MHIIIIFQTILIPMSKRFQTLFAAGILSVSVMFGEISIIPAPQSLTKNNGTFVFQKDETVSIPAYTGDSIAASFAIMNIPLETAAGANLTPGDNGRIALRLKKGMADGAYTLDVTPDSIIIGASKPEGFFHGMQTLLQLLPVKSTEPASVEAVAIVDEPRFEWRGFMLDEGRHFFGKQAVKRVIDMMALYKMNRFHWHLTEDQGWRLEIKAYPELTKTATTRVGNRLGWGKGRKPGTDSYGDGLYYTQDDIREVVQYAKDRFIEIVPEIDLPGHMQAAVAAYPELSCDPENPHEVWNLMGVSRDVLNVANPKTIKFTNDIIDEVVELFPFGYLHLGGDECPTDKWEQTPECQELLKKIGSDNYRDLQLNYYKELLDHMKTLPADKQRRLIFWNEVLHGNTDLIDNDFVIMSWVDWEKAAKDATSRGHNTIMTPIIPYYINRVQDPGPNEPEGAGRGTETLEAAFAYEPLTNVTENADKYMGVQANFWTEWVDGEGMLQYLMLPRLAAVAERGWSPQGASDFNNFVERLSTWHAPYYTFKGWNFGKHALK